MVSDVVMALAASPQHSAEQGGVAGGGRVLATCAGGFLPLLLTRKSTRQPLQSVSPPGISIWQSIYPKKSKISSHNAAIK